MKGFDEEELRVSFRGYDREYVDEILQEKDRLLSVAWRDVEALKREINTLKKQINHSRTKKK